MRLRRFAWAAVCSRAGGLGSAAWCLQPPPTGQLDKGHVEHDRKRKNSQAAHKHHTQAASRGVEPHLDTPQHAFPMVQIIETPASETWHIAFNPREDSDREIAAAGGSSNTVTLYSRASTNADNANAGPIGAFNIPAVSLFWLGACPGGSQCPACLCPKQCLSNLLQLVLLHLATNARHVPFKRAAMADNVACILPPTVAPSQLQEPRAIICWC